MDFHEMPAAGGCDSVGGRFQYESEASRRDYRLAALARRLRRLHQEQPTMQASVLLQPAILIPSACAARGVLACDSVAAAASPAVGPGLPDERGIFEPFFTMTVCGAT